MTRWVYSARTVIGDPRRLDELLRGSITELLRAATGSPVDTPAADGSLAIRLSARLLGADVSKTVRLRTGVATVANGRLKIPVHWHAEPGRVAFPVFNGTVELDPVDPSSAQLALVGSYTVPLDPLGEAADIAMLHTVAQRTADWLLDHLAQQLTQALESPPAPAQQPAHKALCVGDVMSTDPLVLDAGLPLRTAALLLFHYGVSGAPVVDADGALIGVLSEADLLDKEAGVRLGFGRAAAASERRRAAATVGDACTRPARVTCPDAPLQAVAAEMRANDVARLVAVDGSRIAGIITRHDVLKALIRTDAELRKAVEVMLADMGEPEVRATVEWGVVTLEGTASTCSRTRVLVSAAESIDGVASVQGDTLGWRVDDVSPIADHPLL